MSIPDKAVEAAARAQIVGRWEDKSARERSVHLRRARKILEAAEPYLTGGEGLRKDVEDLLLWATTQHRKAEGAGYSAGEYVAFRDMRDYLTKILAAHPEVKS